MPLTRRTAPPPIGQVPTILTLWSVLSSPHKLNSTTSVGTADFRKEPDSKVLYRNIVLVQYLRSELPM